MYAPVSPCSAAFNALSNSLGKVENDSSITNCLSNLSSCGLDLPDSAGISLPGCLNERTVNVLVAVSRNSGYRVRKQFKLRALTVHKSGLSGK